MAKSLFFSGKELAVVVAVGLGTGLADHQLEGVLFGLVARVPPLLLFGDYLQFVTGGPVFGDFLQTWLEYGGVLAACLVRKPAAGALALTVNGLCQVFVYGTHDPHLLYGFSGLGADLTFAYFRFRRYDFPTVCLAGISCGVFWYPIVWFTHGIYQYPLSFILADFPTRVLGSAIGDGLLGAALAFAILRSAGRLWDSHPAPIFTYAETYLRSARAAGLALVLVGLIFFALTLALPSLSTYFQGLGPKIPSGIPSDEEYNLGIVLGVLMLFLGVVLMAFSKLMSRLQ